MPLLPTFSRSISGWTNASAVPAIASVMLAGALPLSGAPPRQLEIDGRSSASGAGGGSTKPTVFTTTVGAGYSRRAGPPGAARTLVHVA